MDLDTAKKKARELLPIVPPSRQPVGFTEMGRRDGAGQDFVAQLGAMTPPGFSFPELILFGFTELLGMKPYGPEEKLRWGLNFEFKEAIFSFELRKFGLRLLCEEANLESGLVREVLGRTRGLTDVVEAYLSQEVIPAQLATGAATVHNVHRHLIDRYQFLRAEADAAYKRPPPPPESGTMDGGGTWTSQDIGRPMREGGALATAAVDAYFSCLEHLFVIAAAFSPAAMADDGLRGLLNANWSERARRVLDLSDPAVKKTYDQLVNIREDWRNPLAHGGFHVADASLYFHLPGVAALPVRLRRTPAGVKAGFQLHHRSFAEICTTFDQLDHQMRTGRLACAVLWAESGLDVAFDSASLSKYRDATASKARFEQLIERESYVHDMHANMDY